MKLEIRLKADSHLKKQFQAGFADLALHHNLKETTTEPDKGYFELTLLHDTETPETFLKNLATFVTEFENSLPAKHEIEVLVRNSDSAEPTLRTSENNRPFTPVEGIRIVPWPAPEHNMPESHDIFLDSSSDAFGNGLHPSTRLCLQLLVQTTRGAAETGLIPNSVLDIGCGSGILAIAALRLGAHTALGLEIDRRAVQTARRNVKLNHLRDSINILQTSWHNVTGSYDLVLANLVPSVLSKAVPHLIKLLNPRGRIITAGFPEARNTQFLELFENSNLHLITEISTNGWGALLLSP